MQAQKVVWGADAATMIMGVAGKWQGAGEFLQITQAEVPFGANEARLGGCGEQGTQGFVQAFRVGSTGAATVARFQPVSSGAGPNAEFVVSTAPNATREVVMVTASQAMCYFNRISGNFDSAADGVEIVRNSQGAWVLKTFGNNVHQARARCFLRTQP